MAKRKGSREPTGPRAERFVESSDFIRGTGPGNDEFTNGIAAARAGDPLPSDASADFVMGYRLVNPADIDKPRDV